MRRAGRVWKYGDNVDTDVLYPGKYLAYFEPEEVAKHALEGLDEGFSSKVSQGDILVAGKNFGCGSAREQAARTLKYAGINLIIADSFCRTFFRNAIAIGLPVIEYAKASAEFHEGDVLEADIDSGILFNRTTGCTVRTSVMPPFLLEMLQAGGALYYYKAKIAEEQH